MTGTSQGALTFETASRGAVFVHELRQIAWLALSLCVVHVGYHLTGFVDTVLAGRVGGETLAATGLGSGLYFGFSVFGVGVVMGLDPILAQHLGAGETRLARRSMWQGWVAAALVAVPLTAAILCVGVGLPSFGIAPGLADKTMEYLVGRLPSLWFLLASVSLRAYLQASHRTRPIVFAVVVTNLVNLIADWILLFGDAGLVQLGLPGIGLPSFGVAGLAWASAGATVIQLVVLTIAVLARDRPDSADTEFRIEWRILGQIFRVGTPLGLQLWAETGVFALVGLLMGRLGTQAMACHQVALQLAGMTFSVALGIGAATSVQVGRAIGRGDTLGTRQAGFAGICVGVLFMSAMAVLMLTRAELLASWMTSDVAIIPVAASLISIAAVFQVADGIQAVGAGALRGAGATRWTFGANFVGHWLVGLPFGLVAAFWFGMGQAGLWWGLTVGLGFVACALAGRFVYVSRKPILRLSVNPESPLG